METGIINLDIVDMLGYNILEEETRNSLTINPKLKKEVNGWLEKNVGKGQLSAVKICKIKWMDYDNINFEELDEFELKELKRQIKSNESQCPSHRTCPMFMNQSLAFGEKCVLEMMDTHHITKGLFEELGIEMGDFNDQIIVGQLVSLNIIYNRAMRGLSAMPLIEENRSFKNGQSSVETKINENFGVIKQTTDLMEKLRKSLILNRDDKLKVKQIKKANDELSAKKRIEEKMRTYDEAHLIGEELINSIIGENFEIEDIEV